MVVTRHRHTDVGVEFFFDTRVEAEAFVRTVERLGLCQPNREPKLPLVVQCANPWVVTDQWGTIMGTLDLVYLANREYEQGERHKREFDL